MERALFKEKIDAMLPDLMEAIRKETMRLYDSGGVDTEAYGDDWQLPKLCLSVALENQPRQYSPLSPQGKRAMANLRHF